MNQLTKITIAWELHESGVPKSHIASQLQLNRETVRIWIRAIQEIGLLQFLEDHTMAKKGERAKRKTDGLLKARIYRLREENRDCCGQKIQEFLLEEYGISLSVTSIYKILAEKYQLRSKWKHNQKRGSMPEADKPREVVQMDSVDFGQVFAFTAIDIYCHSDLIQSDGGPEFKDQFKAKVYQYTDRYRISAAYKKNEQSYIESFNRTVRKECLGWSKYKPNQISDLTKMVDIFLNRYHYHRSHIGLGMKPPLKT